MRSIVRRTCREAARTHALAGKAGTKKAGTKRESRLVRIGSRGALVLSALAILAATRHETPDARWWAPGEDRVFPRQLDYPNAHGVLRVLHDGEPVRTADNAFFMPLGPNGRACVSCHQPADGMSLSVESIRDRWQATEGKDPIFAAVDGSDCPTLPQGERASHSLLLDHGLFRIERPWPPHDWSGKGVKPDFTIEVVRDPTGCNSGNRYGPNAKQPNISVYRRPRPVANLKYIEAIGFAYDPKAGLPVPVDPETGKPVAGNLMADGRVPTLTAQMNDAARAHLELSKQMTPAQKQQVLTFIRSIYTAQQAGPQGGALDADGAEGGPATLRDLKPGQLGSTGRAVWSEFDAWGKLTAKQKAALSPRELAFRESVARGAAIFRDRNFLITDSQGINAPVGFGNPVRYSCRFCHNMSQIGIDVAPGQVDLGTTNAPFASPQPWLPLFRVTCKGRPHPFYGREILTHDPGYALTTGKCADVGRITLQSNRALAARAPYFSNGSAKDLRGIVDYYDRRYSIRYSEQEKQDLVNLMSAL